MGRVTAPFGVKGWVKIYTLTGHPANLCDYPVWWVGREGGWREIQVIAAKLHSNTLVAHLEGLEDREAAAALKGLDIAVPRSELPAAGGDEFYWADLIGLKVINIDDEELGRVSRIVQTGANDVLVVVADGGADKCERLIPFIADVIRSVDVAAGKVVVDWGKDY